VGLPEKKNLPTDEYDVIGAFDVIEHLRDPKQSLESARRPQVRRIAGYRDALA
jgi:predicted RNA-binding protein with PIN domain